MKFVYLLSILLINLALSKTASAQILENFIETRAYANYVPNSGFENLSRTYCGWNQNGRKYMEAIASWDSPTETTPDILSLRLKPNCWSNPTKHSSGKQGPRNGDNMAGIKTYGKGGTETFWHEYLMVRLDTSLKKGERYYAEFYASRAVKSDRASNNLGMLFTDSAIITRDRMPVVITPQINEDEIVKSRWNSWKKISGVFEAQEDMHYLLIGNFYQDDATATTDFPDGEGGAYYYIDDVLVRRAGPEEALTPEPRSSTPPRPKVILAKAKTISTTEIKLDSINYRVGNTITLANIFFEFDKATLLPESKTELEKLVDILSDYPHLHIEIGGHTDAMGTNDYNQKLSSARAKSVADYLLDEKVEPERVSSKGYGSTKPIATNNTDNGRAKNRRVEFTVLQD